MDANSVVGLAILDSVGIMARSFNGTTDVITTGFSFVQPPFSLAVWFNSTTVTPVQAMIGSNIAQAVEFRLNATALEFVESGTAVIGSSSATIAANTWYGAVATFDAAQNWAIYLTGNSSSSGTQSGIVLNNTPLQIGNQTNFSESWAGSLADVAVWNVILSAAEGASLVQGARPFTIRPKSLIGYWPVDGLQSPEPDLSGSKNNGTLTGTALASGPPIAPFTPRWPQFLVTAAVPPPPPLSTGYAEVEW